MLLSERLSNVESYQIKKMPARVIPVPQGRDFKQVYKEPLYFMQIIFKKRWAIHGKLRE